MNCCGVYAGKGTTRPKEYTLQEGILNLYEQNKYNVSSVNHS